MRRLPRMWQVRKRVAARKRFFDDDEEPRDIGGIDAGPTETTQPR